MRSKHFKDRTEAGEELAQTLASMHFKDPIVLALPRGGVPVAVPVARALNAPLDLIMVKKIGMPGHTEYAIGAVVDGAAPHIVKNPQGFAMSGLSEEGFKKLAQEKLAEIDRRKKEYGAGVAVPVKGRTAIVVDDGIATGTSVKAAIGALRAQRPERIVLAIPVAPRSSVSELSAMVDDIVCLMQPPEFFAVGAHYRDFEQTSDQTVTELMREFRNPPKNTGVQ